MDPEFRSVPEVDSQIDWGARASSAPVVIPVLEESLRVDRVATDQGGYRISKHVTTREERLDELLRHRRVQIERREIGERLEGNSMPEPRYEGDTLIIPVVEEVLVTEKRLVLVEEVRITLVEGTHPAGQTVTLRKEEVSIERLAPDMPSGRSRN
jgi:uncharacterized protein (TIGR02271 family)